MLIGIKDTQFNKLLLRLLSFRMQYWTKTRTSCACTEPLWTAGRVSLWAEKLWSSNAWTSWPPRALALLDLLAKLAAESLPSWYDFLKIFISRFFRLLGGFQALLKASDIILQIPRLHIFAYFFSQTMLVVQAWSEEKLSYMCFLERLM